MAAVEHPTETAGAPMAEPPAPSPSQNTPKPPRGSRFEAKDEGDLRAQVAQLRALVTAQGEQLQRLAAALGRADAILPVATPEQIKAAHDAGDKLKVISEITRSGLRLQAGRVIEARHYRVDTLMDLAAAGLLRVAVVPKAS